MVAHAFKPSTWEAVILHEFEASLVCSISCRTQRNFVLKLKTKKPKSNKNKKTSMYKPISKEKGKEVACICC